MKLYKKSAKNKIIILPVSPETDEELIISRQNSTFSNLWTYFFSIWIIMLEHNTQKKNINVALLLAIIGYKYLGIRGTLFIIYQVINVTNKTLILYIFILGHIITDSE